MSSKPDESDKPVDVLAADEFPVGGPDPEVDQPAEPAHDVLAADEFEVPAPDPKLKARKRTTEPADEHEQGAQHPHRYGAGPVQMPKSAVAGVAAVVAGLIGFAGWRRQRHRRQTED